jgi:hypothetical protein
VEVRVERQQVAPFRVGLESLDRTVGRTPAVGVGEPNRHEAMRQVGCHVAQAQPLAGTRRVLDGEFRPQPVVPVPNPVWSGVPIELKDGQELDRRDPEFDQIGIFSMNPR